ncbi:hypothetical protein [Stutzerimonas xanthomarina]|uniref:hypothetical protein n=1 Tax=Stutzerimonas xanthomarina TaxID=271420 RepID=UPI003AA8D59C
MLVEAGDKASDDDKAAIEKALGELKATRRRQGRDRPRSLRSQASTPVAQKMYAEQAGLVGPPADEQTVPSATWSTPSSRGQDNK